MRKFQEMGQKSIGVLFDLDGVLIDSEREYTRIWGEINRLFPSGYPDLPQRIKGMTLDKILETFYSNGEDTNEIRSVLHSLENRMKYEWLPGAKEFVEWLISENIPRVLVTSSDDKKMAHLRQELPELEKMMTAIVTADKITHSKPDPEGYLLGASMINAKPRNCAVFEDSRQGVKAGEASGAYVIGVAGTLPAEVIAPHCSQVVGSMDEIDRNEFIKILETRRQ